MYFSSSYSYSHLSLEITNLVLILSIFQDFGIYMVLLGIYLE